MLARTNFCVCICFSFEAQGGVLGSIPTGEYKFNLFSIFKENIHIDFAFPMEICPMVWSEANGLY